jgi:predicted secreted protein
MAQLYVGTAGDGSGQIRFGELDEVDINKMRDMLDATSHDAQGAKVKKPGLIDWNGSAKGLHLDADVTQKQLRDALDGSTPLYITVYPMGVGIGKAQWQGACYIKDFKFTAPVRDLAKCEFTLEGSGFLTESLQDATGDLELVSIAVTPADATIAHAATQQCIATATYGDASTAVVTSLVDWAVDDPTKATIDGSGLATGVAAGAVNITASMGHVSGTTTLTLT